VNPTEFERDLSPGLDGRGPQARGQKPGEVRAAYKLGNARPSPGLRPVKPVAIARTCGIDRAPICRLPVGRDAHLSIDAEGDRVAVALVVEAAG
jgi:hypothetical protein